MASFGPTCETKSARGGEIAATRLHERHYWWPYLYGDLYIPEEAIKSRVLTVIVPIEGTSAQQEVMHRIVELGTQRGLTVNFKIYP